MNDERLQKAAQQVIREFGESAGNVYRLMIRESCRFEDAKTALDKVAVEREKWREIS